MLTHFRGVLALSRRSLWRHAYSFTRKQKAKQLILFTPEQIEKMHLRRVEQEKGVEEIERPWKAVKDPNKDKFRVSLVGLPNCGKSSLFNCLIGEKVAIVDKLRGMTRDRKQFTILNGLVSLIDTPGVQIDCLKAGHKQQLKDEIFKQTITAIHESNLILLVVDAKHPIGGADLEFANYLKAFTTCEVVLVCNKCDNLYDEGDVVNQAQRLGFQTMFPVSAEEGNGVLELLNFIHSKVPEQLKTSFVLRQQMRKIKFEAIVQKMKAEVKLFNSSKGKTIKIKEWEDDFRSINADPRNNEALDEELSEESMIRPEEAFMKGRGTSLQNLRFKSTIKICFLGRPNVGKSSLINEMIGTDKMVVSDVPGTTRDAIRTHLEYKGRKIQIIDTAGLDSPHFNRGFEEYEKKVKVSTMLHVQESHVVVFVMDAFESFRIDDFTLIQRVIEEGRPVVIAVNKWEAIKEPYRYKAKNYLLKQLEKHLGQLHGDPLVFVSAKMHLNLDGLMDKVITTYDKWNTRISTGLLNNWLQNFKKLANLPKEEDYSLKINYLIQARVRPPLFIFFVNCKGLFKNHYMRFVMRNMAKEFGMDGIPLRNSLRSTNNREHKFKKQRVDRHKTPTQMKMDQLRNKYANFGI